MNAEVAHPRTVAAVAERLGAAGVPSARADARWLVEHVASTVGEPEGAGAALLEELTARREAREPLQLILGSTAFRHLELLCAPGVFVPRPETEVVAGAAIAAVREASAKGRDGVRVVEVGTGTGAIALSLAAEVAGVEVVAGDRDPAAVALARRNLRRVAAGEAGGPLAQGSHVEVVTSDLLDDVESGWRGTVDVLVSNPPYLPARDRVTWEPEVRDHDPEAALVGGVDGHELVDRLLLLAASWLASGGAVVIEIDERRVAAARTAAREAGLADVEVVADLTGAARAVTGRRR